MDIKKKIEDKQKELEKLVAQHNELANQVVQIEQQKGQLVQEILKLQGAISALKEL
jgi:prefoldin subunit 5